MLHQQKPTLEVKSKVTATHIVTAKMTPRDPHEEDDEMTQYLASMRNEKAKGMTDSDFDTDLEEDFGESARHARAMR